MSARNAHPRKVRCPGCRSVFQAPGDTGRFIKCPKCDKSLTLRPRAKREAPRPAPKKTHLLVLVAAGVAVAAALGWFFFLKGDPGTPSSALPEQEVEDYSKEAEQAAGLSFRSPVTVLAIPDDEFLRELEKELELTPEQMRELDVTTRFFGLKRSDDLRQSVLSAHADVQAFYSPRTKKVYVNDDAHLPGLEADPSGPVARWARSGVIVHELTHALQDQHYDVGAVLKDLEAHGDALNAFRATLEGHALLAMNRAMVKKLSEDPELVDALIAFSKESQAEVLGASPQTALDDQGMKQRLLKMTPEQLMGTNLSGLSADPAFELGQTVEGFLRRMILQLYYNGGTYVLRSGRPDAVETPPISTLELYRAAHVREAEAGPVPLVDLKDPERLLGSDWSLEVEGELGWMGISALRGAAPGGASPVRVISDRYWIYERDDQLAGVWHLSFPDWTAPMGIARTAEGRGLAGLPKPLKIFWFGNDVLMVGGLPEPAADEAAKSFLASVRHGRATSSKQLKAFHAGPVEPDRLDAQPQELRLAETLRLLAQFPDQAERILDRSTEELTEFLSSRKPFRMRYLQLL